MSNYYEQSGKFSIKSIFLFLLMCVTVYPLLGVIYAYGIIYIPFVYILFILSGFYGYAIGFSTSLIVFKLGKVRNTKLAYILGSIAILIAFYLHWAIWICLVYGYNPIEAIGFAMNPGFLIDAIKEVNSVGTWSLGTLKVNGLFLSVIWILELIVATLISFIISIEQVRNPFCEKADKWFDKKVLAPFSFIENQKDFTSKMEMKNSEILDTLQTEREFETESHSEFTLFFSKSNEYYLSVQNKEKKMSKGEIDFDEINVFENLRINKEIADKLKSF